MNRSRKRKSLWTDNSFSEYEPRSKRIKSEGSYKTKKKYNKVINKNSSTLMIADTREIRIILDRTIVDKYFQAKQTLRDILSPKPIIKIAYRRKNEKSKKQTSLLDYMQTKRDVTSNETQIHQIKKESADFVVDDDQNITPTYDVNTMPSQPSQIMYYIGNNCQSNCFVLDNNLVILPSNAQFTPEEFVYNNYGFLPIMGLPEIKTEFSEDLPVKEETDDISMNSSITIYDHTITDIEDIATTSTPNEKDIHNEQTLINCYSDEETKITSVEFGKHDSSISIFGEKTMKLSKSDEEAKFTSIKFDKRGRPICPKCDRSFKILEAFKQHKLLCGLEFLYECLYCDYNAKVSYVFKKHVLKMHKVEVEKEGLERILMEIRKRRMNKKNLSLMSKENEVDSGAEESFVKSLESKLVPSKLTFDLFCPSCEKSFKRINGIPLKMCPNCQVSLVFKCQTCGDSFLKYIKAYRHVNNKCGTLKKGSTNKRSSINFVNYHCDHCDFKTWHKAAIRKHIFHRHMKNDESAFYKCNLCSFRTLYDKNFERHQQNVHKMNETIDLDD